MFAPPKYEIYTKMTKKVLISIYNVENLYLFSHQKQPPYLLHLMFKTYVLTNNIKVNTTKFVSMGLMKLATKNHGAGHLPPRRFIFNWPLLTRSFLLIPHCSFLWFHAILRIMEQQTIYKCYYSYKCWICAELCGAFIFLMKNIYTYVQFEGMIYQQIVGIAMGTNCAPLIADLLSSRNSVGGDIVTRPFVDGWVSEWVGAWASWWVRHALPCGHVSHYSFWSITFKLHM